MKELLTVSARNLKRGDRIPFPGGRVKVVVEVRATDLGDVRVRCNERGHGTHWFGTFRDSRFDIEVA